MNLKILVLLLVLIFIIYAMGDNIKNEYMDNIKNEYIDNIQAYVITLKKPDRLNNIEENKKKLKLNIELVDAVLGDILNFEDLINTGKISKDFYEEPLVVEKVRKREIGCYLSHLKIYELIMKNNLPGYSIIFEDDFKIIDDDFVKTINNAINILKNHDDNFDLLFLGNTSNNKGIHVDGNVYSSSKDGDLYGTHAILINNKKINNIYDKLKYINGQIDVNLTRLNYEYKLNNYILSPTVVDQADLQSTIVI